jgi:hypothetical protein
MLDRVPRQQQQRQQQQQCNLILCFAGMVLDSTSLTCRSGSGQDVAVALGEVAQQVPAGIDTDGAAGNTADTTAHGAAAEDIDGLNSSSSSIAAADWEQQLCCCSRRCRTLAHCRR